MKLLTLEDYQKVGEEFWPKYWYAAKELGEGARTEDILKVMEACWVSALKLKLEEDKGADLFGFNKKDDTGLEEGSNEWGYRHKPHWECVNSKWKGNQTIHIE